MLFGNAWNTNVLETMGTQIILSDSPRDGANVYLTLCQSNTETTRSKAGNSHRQLTHTRLITHNIYPQQVTSVKGSCKNSGGLFTQLLSRVLLLGVNGNIIYINAGQLYSIWVNGGRGRGFGEEMDRRQRLWDNGERCHGNESE